MNVVIDGVDYIPKPRIRPGQTFPQALKTARDNSGETLEQVANAVGTTKSHMWTLERGDCEPRMGLIKGLLDHYGLRFEDVCAPTGGNE
jgi:transcriptional regulator with XRE-family HTH domain